MIVTRTCPMCNNVTEKELNITDEQLYTYQNTMALIQNVFPNLTGTEREFIKTGYCDECQSILFDTWLDE